MAATIKQPAIVIPLTTLSMLSLYMDQQFGSILTPSPQPLSLEDEGEGL